jgi:hypothetical protein
MIIVEPKFILLLIKLMRLKDISWPSPFPQVIFYCSPKLDQTSYPITAKVQAIVGKFNYWCFKKFYQMLRYIVRLLLSYFTLKLWNLCTFWDETWPRGALAFSLTWTDFMFFALLSLTIFFRKLAFADVFSASLRCNFSF